ncbi:hypothetical protein [Rhizobium sp. Leaf262]|uniref:hypothetical protein n=1 Tax=Rhizobium sp. Leaf262 TaxID=1736312 RepID=UPI000A441E6E|nr:hypothetical protein [Rhizobium sp. Leaf262]
MAEADDFTSDFAAHCSKAVYFRLNRRILIFDVAFMDLVAADSVLSPHKRLALRAFDSH